MADAPRRPSSIIPLQSSVLPNKGLLRPPVLPLPNGFSHLGISAAAAAAAAAVSGHSLQQHHLHMFNAKSKLSG